MKLKNANMVRSKLNDVQDLESNKAYALTMLW